MDIENPKRDSVLARTIESVKYSFQKIRRELTESKSHSYKKTSTRESYEKDKESLAKDWDAIGKDFETVIGKHKNKKEQSK